MAGVDPRAKKQPVAITVNILLGPAAKGPVATPGTWCAVHDPCQPHVADVAAEPFVGGWAGELDAVGAHLQELVRALVSVQLGHIDQPRPTAQELDDPEAEFAGRFAAAESVEQAPDQALEAGAGAAGLIAAPEV